MYPSHLLAGTSGAYSYIYDLNSLSKPIFAYNTVAATICCKTNDGGLYIAVGGADGKIRLLDGKLRTNNILHTLDGYSGIVNDIAVETDGVNLFSCGMSGRSINPYDPTSPTSVSV